MTTIKTAITNIAVKIIASAGLEDDAQTEAFRAEITKACESELNGKFVPAGEARVAPQTVSATPAKAKGAGGPNGYTRFSHVKREELTEEMGEEKAKAYFKEQGGVNSYIPKLWAALSAEEQAKWNAEAKEIRETAPVATSTEATAVKKNDWHGFQKAFPAYLAAEKIAVPFTGLATATGAKYQELKKIPGAVAEFIAKYPPQPKVKKAKAKAGAAASAPVSI